MSAKVESVNNFVKVYRLLTEHPAISYGQILSRTSNPDFTEVTSVWNQRNIERGELSKFQKNHFIKTTDAKYESAPVDISSEELSRLSCSEVYNCILRQTKTDNKKKQYLEIWTKSGLFKNFDVDAFDVHGEIYSDVEFASLEWSPNEEKLAYIAEKKVKKALPFYQQKSSDTNSQDDDKTELGGKYIYRPDWGEQLVGKHQPVVAICNIKDETLKVLEGIPANFSPGQLVWSGDGTGIYGIVLENEPRRLGLVYCTNRLSYVFYITLKGEFKILSDPNKSVRSPRLSPDKKSLFWLQRPAGGSHAGCAELVKLDLTTNKKQVLIEVVSNPGKTFSGMFLHSLPRRCFSKDGTKLFFSSLNKTVTSSYYLDLGTKEIHRLETGEGSSSILDVHEDSILISTANLRQPPALKISKSITKVEWIPLTKVEVISKDFVIKEMEFESKSPSHKYKYYNGVYYGPPAPSASGAKLPLIVYPHGGPHSAFTNDYSLEANFFVSLGYGVLMVNYRGSTGAGQDGIEFLLGKIGDTDVKDNQEAVLDVLKSIPYLDPKNVFLYGKSHGGYLVEQLSAQYPDFYRSVVSLNPVTDVTSMYILSDIPDWATSESGLVFDESKPLTSEQMAKMVSVSPVQLVDKIKAPTLFLIGKKDLRVPPYEGIRMYNALKARKVKTRLHLYDDNHTLGSVPNHIDCVINSALWFLENKA